MLKDTVNSVWVRVHVSGVKVKNQILNYILQ